MYTVLPLLLDAAERHTLPDHLKPSQKEFDKSIGVILSDAVDSTNPDALPVLLRVIRYSGARSSISLSQGSDETRRIFRDGRIL